GARDHGRRFPGAEIRCSPRADRSGGDLSPPAVAWERVHPTAGGRPLADADQTGVDDREGGRFVYVEDGVEAELLYRARDGRLILVHTEVPDQLGGRGIGGRLVRTAVERAARTGETTAPWCPYARR